MSPLLLLLAVAALAVGVAWLAWRRVSCDATRLGGVHPNRPIPPSGPASGSEPAFRADTLEDLIRGGNLLDAVKRIRERTGLGLVEAKDRVEFFRAQGRWPEAAEARSAWPEAAEAEVPVSAPQTTGIEALIRHGNLIQAIKLAREQNPGMDLRTAKELVEVLAARLR